MSTSYQATDQFVTRTDKADAKKRISELFTSGQISADEYGRRLHGIERSEDWGQLQHATTSGAPASTRNATAGTKDWVPFLIHVSGAWMAGAPLVAWLFIKDPVLKREAAKAFNFQLLMFVAMIVTSILFGWMGAFDVLASVPEAISGIVRAIAAVVGIVAGLVTLNGKEWKYPVSWFGKRGPLSEE